MGKSKKMTVSELCETLKISESLFKQKWLKKTPAIPRRKNGRSFIYDIKNVYKWMLECGMIKYAALLEKEGFVVVEKVNIPPPSDGSGLDIYNAFDELGQIIKNKLASLKLLSGASSVSETAAVKGLLGELRMYQKAIMEMDKELKTVILVDSVKRHIATILTGVRTDLCALPYSIHDELAVESDPEKVREILSDRIEDCLRHTSEKLDKFEIEEPESE